MNRKSLTLLGMIAIFALVVVGIYFADTANKTVATSQLNSLADISSTTSSTSASDSMNKKIDCASQMTQFQNRVLAQEKATNPNASVYDFFIAYSPKQNTCVGGYTIYLNYKFTSTDTNLYEYHIEDVLTGVGIDEFSGYGTDSQKAWEEYKTKLSALTSGVIPAPGN